MARKRRAKIALAGGLGLQDAKDTCAKLVQALEKFDTVEVDLSELTSVDLNMPVMTGIEFIRKYRAHPSSAGVPIVFLTTESDEELKSQAKAAGATGWIVKPFKQDQLLAVVKKIAGS